MQGAGATARVALVGLGAAARRIHFPALQMSRRARLVGGVDPDLEARARFASLAPDLPLEASLEGLLDGHEADWALIGAPPAAHRDLCIEALSRGLHVFCEKPFTERLEDADAVLEAAGQADRQVAVNHEFPRMPIFESARRTIDSDGFGGLLFAQAWQHVCETDEGGWRAAGRTMQEFGTHVVDLMVQFHDAFPQGVFAQMPRFPGRPEADPVDLITLVFPGGRAASIVLDRVCRGEHRYLELRLDGERASLRASIGGRVALSLFVAPRRRRPRARLELAAGGQAWLELGDQRRVLARNPANAFASATSSLLDAAIRAAARKEEVPSSARYARGIVAVVEAAYESARTGQLVVPRICAGSPSA